MGLIVFEQVTAADLTGPAEVFSRANISNGYGCESSCNDVLIRGVTMQPCMTECGIVLKPHTDLGGAPPLDTVIVSGGSGISDAKVTTKIAKWLNYRASTTRRSATLGTGIYALAATGMLDHRQVAIHWRYARDVARRFPSLRVNANCLFVKDGPFYTSAGTMAGIFTYWDQLFDVGLRGEMGEFGDYFKTWNWEMGFRYSRNEGQDLSIGEVSQPGLRDALLDTDPATAFNAFGGFFHQNSARARQAVYVTLHNSGEYELPIGYATINGDLFNLPAGPVSFAIGGEYDAPRFTRDRDALNNTFSSIGSTDGQSFRVNRDIWGIYEEVRVPYTSPTWNFPGFYSFEVDFAEREEWYSQNTSGVLPSGLFPGGPSVHSTYNAQKPKVSVRWQPLDPKYIGAVTLRGSYSEAFHAPTLSELTPASSQNFPIVADPFSTQTLPQIEERILGNPNTHPEVAYEWTYGIVYSPKWVKGLTLSADWWHIDMRDIVAALGAQTIIQEEPPPTNGASTVVGSLGQTVVRAVGTNPTGEPGPVVLVIDPSANLSGAIFEGLDYEAIYILDSTIFGHGDWGRLTTTVNGTWLSRAEFQASSDVKRVGIGGEFLPPAFALTSSLPWHRANFSIFYDGPADTWMQGLGVGAVVHWTGQYEDDNASLTGSTKLNEPRSGPLGGGDEVRARKVSALTTLDLILNYTFNLPPPAPAEVPGFAKDGGKNVKMKDGKEKNVVPVSTAEYGCSNWKWWLNNTTVTLGMQNVTDEDPPFVGGSFENGYDESLTTIKGRFWYVGLKKRF